MKTGQLSCVGSQKRSVHCPTGPEPNRGIAPYEGPGSRLGFGRLSFDLDLTGSSEVFFLDRAPTGIPPSLPYL